MTDWRAGWEPFDPLRPCYTCGEEPSHYFDREKNEPGYGCDHPPYIDRGDEPEVGHLSTMATLEEWELAYKRARKMIKENDERGWKTKFVPRGSSRIEMMARGQVAEIIAARLTGLKRDGTYLKSGYRRAKKRSDIGSNVEVRNTRWHDGDLALYDNDPPDRVALLVTGADPFVIRGWIRVKHGKLRKLYRPSPAPSRWIVPQSLLHPMPLPPDA